MVDVGALIALLTNCLLVWLTLWLGVFRVERLLRRGPVLETYNTEDARPTHAAIVVIALIAGIMASAVIWTAFVVYLLLGLLLLKFFSKNSTPRIICILTIAGTISFSAIAAIQYFQTAIPQ